MSRPMRQGGTALVLVMWLIAAMGITVGGALALARDEIGLASSRLGEAQAFALGKGIARLAVLDRARAKTIVDENGDPDPAGLARVFKSHYAIDGFRITATVRPASGFVSVAESDPEVWQRLLSTLGGVDAGEAAQLANNIVENQFASASAGFGSRGGFEIFSRDRQSRSAIYVEQLLGVEGMTRSVYDRIRDIISPFNVGSGVDTAVAPQQVAAIFGSAEERTGEMPPRAANLGGAQGYYCVEIEVSKSSSEKFTQNVWLESRTTDQYSSISVRRIELPKQKVLRRAG